MAIERKERHKIPEQAPEVRRSNFEEVCTGFDLETAKAEATRCLQCKNAPCRTGCPVAVHIPEFIKALAAGNVAEAGAIVKSTNSLPSVCGRVCPQESQCEKFCVRGKMEGPVAIGGLERFVGDYMLNEPTAKSETKAHKCVAVVGSGPAGLTCASELASYGAEVTVYEAFHKPGGVLVYGIPEFRLPKKLVQAEIDKLAEKGVKFELNCVIGKSITVEELLAEYDAVFLGNGAGLPMFMGIPGENLNGVLSANEYLTRVNLMKAYDPESPTPVLRGKNVCVIGAGNVAMDAARTALRLGANVKIIYRRSRAEMPARAEEIHHAEQEGIEFELLTNPIQMTGQDGWVTGLTCVRMQLGEPDAGGRRRPIEVPNSQFSIACDTVIVALGTSPNPLARTFGVALNPKGTIVVDEDMMTDQAGVYAGGDAVTGAATVILAMGAGRKASKAIAARLGLTDGE